MGKLKIFGTLFLLAVMGVTAYFLIPAKDTFSLKQVVPELTTALANFRVPEEVGTTLENIGTQAKSLQQHAGKVLGASDSARLEQPIQERAFEYGRYLYCNQVVTDYESRL